MKKYTLWIILALMAFTHTVYAEDKWVKVEVIVFEHPNQDAVSSEYWPQDAGRPATYKALTLQEQDVDEEKTNFSLLDNNELILNDVKKRLISRNKSRILVHKGWRQKIERDGSDLVHLFGGNLVNENGSFFEVDGTMKVSQARYMHVETDLVFNQPMKVLESASGNENKERLATVQSGPFNAPKALKSFRLKEKRKILPSELQLIDHPLFGVIVSVKPDKDKG